MINTVKWFVEECYDKDVGLIVKTNLRKIQFLIELMWKLKFPNYFQSTMTESARSI